MQQLLLIKQLTEKKPHFFQLIKRSNLKYLSCSGKSQVPLLWLPAQASSGCVLICTDVCCLYSAGLGLLTTTLIELLLCAKHYSKNLKNSSERDKKAPRFHQIINKDVIDLLQPSPKSSLKLHLPWKKLFSPLSPQSYCPPGPRQPLIYSLPL